jgi:hypothetical protein
MFMRHRLLLIGMSVIAILPTAPPAFAAANAQSAACSRKADAQDLHGASRKAFRAKCMTGAMSPAAPLKRESAFGSGGAVTKPSGVDPTTRSRECNQEADTRGLTDNARESFRLKCLATAAPPRTTGSSSTPPTPTPANDSLGQLPK